MRILIVTGERASPLYNPTWVGFGRGAPDSTAAARASPTGWFGILANCALSRTRCWQNGIKGSV